MQLLVNLRRRTLAPVSISLGPLSASLAPSVHLLMGSSLHAAVEISVISVVLESVESEFERRDKGIVNLGAEGAEAAMAEEDYLTTLIQREQTVWATFNSQLHHVLDNAFGSFFFAGLHPAGLHHVQETKRTSAFKVLRFHFMARNELLGADSDKFSWATYVKKTMERRVEHMVEVTWRSWLLVICALACGMVGIRCWPHPPAEHVLLFFLAAGWALSLAMWLLFRSSEAVIDGLIIKGHEHRLAAELHHKRIAESKVLSPPNSWRAVKQLMRPPTEAKAHGSQTPASATAPAPASAWGSLLSNLSSAGFHDLVSKAVQENQAETGRRREEAAKNVTAETEGRRSSDGFHLHRGRMPKNAGFRVTEIKMAMECKAAWSKVLRTAAVCTPSSHRLRSPAAYSSCPLGPRGGPHCLHAD